jgi:hypothetical protein
MLMTWGNEPCRDVVHAVRSLSAPTAAKWLDNFLSVRAKALWSGQNVKHLDPLSSGHIWCLQHCDTEGIAYQPYLKHDTPRIASTRARLRLQRAHTNQYRTKFQLPDPAGGLSAENCAFCPTMETVEHVLLVCPKYARPRGQTEKELSLLQRCASPSPLMPSSPSPLPFPFSLPTLLGFVPSSLLKSPLLRSVLDTTSVFLLSIRAIRFL